MNPQRDKLSEGQRAEIPDLYAKGVTITEMTRMFNVSESAIRYWLPKIRTKSAQHAISTAIQASRRFDARTADRAVINFFIAKREGAKSVSGEDGRKHLVTVCGLSKEEAARVYADWRHDYVRGLLKW